MQRASQLVWRAARTQHSSLLPHHVASTSQAQWHAKRGIKTPLQWVRERIVPKERLATPEEVAATAQEEDDKKGVGSVFDAVPKILKKEKAQRAPPKTKKMLQQANSTAHFKISRRKLNMLANQIAGKPIDHAILQMQFSPKRASKRIKTTLVNARRYAEGRGLNLTKVVVAESWVTKGPRMHKRLEIKGRGRTGFREHPSSKLSVILREGKTVDEKAKELLEKKLRKIRSAGLVREDKPLVNIPPMYAW